MSLLRKGPLMASAGGVLAVALLVAMSAAASAAYPPGGYPGPAPAGGFPTVEVSQTLGSSGGTLSATDGAVQISLTVPAGAFSASTQVTIYKGADSVLASLLPSGEQLLLSYAIGWTPSSTPASPLTLTITDTAIPGDAIVYDTTSTGVTPAGSATVTAGSVTLSFTADPGIVVAEPSSASPTPVASPAPVPTTGAGASPGGGSLMLGLVVAVLGILAVVGGVVGWRRRDTVKSG